MSFTISFSTIESCNFTVAASSNLQFLLKNILIKTLKRKLRRFKVYQNYLRGLSHCLYIFLTVGFLMISWEIEVN